MDPIYMIEKECIRRRLSRHTRQAYAHYASQFLKFVRKDVKNLCKADVLNYMDFLAARGFSPSTLNLSLNSIKFMLSSINKKWNIGLRYSKRPRKLPVYLTKEETKKLLLSIQNEKHRLAVMMLYSAGMRVSELVNLKVKDLELPACIGWIRNGKGGKDRIFSVSKYILSLLRQHILNKSQEEFVFPGRRGKISKETIYRIVKFAAKKAGIMKNVHPHTLRHSFATHLIEDKTGLYDVQRCLGHSSPSTTMTYLHALPNPGIISPLDRLEIGITDEN